MLDVNCYIVQKGPKTWIFFAWLSLQSARVTSNRGSEDPHTLPRCSSQQLEACWPHAEATSSPEVPFYSAAAMCMMFASIALRYICVLTNPHSPCTSEYSTTHSAIRDRTNGFVKGSRS